MKVTNKAIGIAFLSFVGLGLFDGLIGVAWPSIRETFGVGNEAYGVLSIVGTLSGVMTAAAVGQLIMRRGLAFVLIASVIVLGSGCFAMVGAPVWWAFIGANGLKSAGMGLLDGGMNTFGAVAFRPRILNWLHASFGLGTMIGSFLMTGLLAFNYGWEVGAAVIGGVMVVLAGLFFGTRGWWVFEGEKEEFNHRGAEDTEIKIWSWGVVGSVVLFFLYSGLEVGVGAWAFTLLFEGRGVDEMTAGTWASLYWGAFTAGRIVLGFIEQNLIRLIRMGVIGALLGTILLWANVADWVNFLSLVVIGVSLAPIFPALIGLTPSRLGVDVAGRVVGYQVAAAGLGVALVPAVCGWIAGRFGVEMITLFLVGVGVLQVGVNEWVNWLSGARKHEAKRDLTQRRKSAKVKQKKIGLFGGTFDPPHYGHHAVAMAALEQLRLDEVRWLPVGNPTHKSRPDMSDVEHRIQMVALEIERDEGFVVDRTDADRPPPHYTATLLPLLREQFPDAQFWLIIGGDSLQNFHKWHEPELILEHCRLAVYARPGAEINWGILAHIPNLWEKADMLEGKEFAVSSTHLRELARDGQALTRQFTPPVGRYVEENGLYR